MDDMKDVQPTWPQTLLMVGLGSIYVLCCYFLSRSYGGWGAVSWGILALLALSGVGFLAAVFLLYLRPRYGDMAFPLFVGFVVFHLVIAAVLWRTGLPG
jgi:hypothetical protein